MSIVRTVLEKYSIHGVIVIFVAVLNDNDNGSWSIWYLAASLDPAGLPWVR